MSEHSYFLTEPHATRVKAENPRAKYSNWRESLEEPSGERNTKYGILLSKRQYFALRDKTKWKFQERTTGTHGITCIIPDTGDTVQPEAPVKSGGDRVESYVKTEKGCLTSLEKLAKELDVYIKIVDDNRVVKSSNIIMVRLKFPKVSARESQTRLSIDGKDFTIQTFSRVFGEAIYDSEGRHVISQRSGNNIYIPFTEVKLDAITTVIVEEIVRGFCQSGGEADPSATREDLHEFIKKSMKKLSGTLKGDIAKKEKEAEEYKKKMIGLKRTIERQKFMLKEKDGTQVDHYGRLKKMRNIERFEVADDIIRFHTSEILCKDPTHNRVHALGKFVLEVNFSNNSVKFSNISKLIHTSTSHPYDAPHINNGTACFGTLEGTVQEVIAKYELSATVSILIQFLESVNREDSYGRKIWLWPLVDETKEQWEERIAAERSREGYDEGGAGEHMIDFTTGTKWTPKSSRDSSGDEEE
jgi:hypothetical protein